MWTVYTVYRVRNLLAGQRSAPAVVTSSYDDGDERRVHVANGMETGKPVEPVGESERATARFANLESNYDDTTTTAAAVVIANAIGLESFRPPLRQPPPPPPPTRIQYYVL
ncbi:hypothetical protein QTP88_023276 [Uroleucon formosanum]